MTHFHHCWRGKAFFACLLFWSRGKVCFLASWAWTINMSASGSREGRWIDGNASLVLRTTELEVIPLAHDSGLKDRRLALIGDLDVFPDTWTSITTLVGSAAKDFRSGHHAACFLTVTLFFDSFECLWKWTASVLEVTLTEHSRIVSCWRTHLKEQKDHFIFFPTTSFKT